MKMRLTLLIENNFRPTIDGVVLSLHGGKDDMIIEKIELLNDNEKIIDGLSRCSSTDPSCTECPYHGGDIDGECINKLMQDAMEAL